jgi:uncharacterized protein (DUF427 family)
MALMTGQGPFGHAPAGSFNRRLPGDGLLYLEPSPRRIRGLLGGEVVVDSTRVSLLLEHGRLPRHYLPEADVRPAPPTEAPPALAGLVAFYWKALDGWLEEDEPALGHARDPYHRVDAVPSSRHVRATLDGVALADSRRTTAIFETAMGPRWYFPRQDIRVELLDGDAHTVCAYKGHATYWSVRLPSGLHENIAWTYLEPRHDALAVGGRVAFFDEQVDLEVDGQPQPRSRTPWSIPRWWERTARLEAQL